MSKSKKDSNKNNIEKSKTNVKNYHDTSFKDIMGRKEIAKDFIEKNLPQEVLDIIDLDTLERKDGTCVNKNLEETFSDLIYGVKVNGKDAYISLLLEHKSSPDKHTIFQVSRYTLDAWMKLSKDNAKEFPVVIPIVFYHGKDRWNYKTDMRDLIPGYYDLPEYIKERMPTMKHNLVDIVRNTDIEMERYRPVVRLAFNVFKYITYKDEDKLMEAFLITLGDAYELEEDKEVVIDIMDRMMVYMYNGGYNLTEEKLMEKIEDLGGKGEKIMTILEEREQKGIQEGEKRGIEKGKKETAKELMRMGLELEKISQATKLSLEEVKKLKDEILN